jgi:hypothetical protein
MVAEDVEIRLLVRQAIAADTPEPAPGFESTTLAAIHGRQPAHPAMVPSGHRRGRLIAALAALAVAALAASAMAYPPAREAVVRLPGLGVLGGLYGETAQRPASLAEATSSGYTLRVTAAYDDGTTVVLAFEVTPAGRLTPRYDDIGWAGTPTVTDSSGRQLDSSFTPVREALSSGLAFTRPPGGSAAGTPLSVEVPGINLLGRAFPGGYRTISGRWTLRFSIRPSSLTVPLPAPANGQLDGGTVTFDEVRANDAYLFVRYTLHGVTPPPGLPAGKGWSPLARVYGPDGSRIAMLSWGTVGDSLTTFAWKGQLAATPGSYRFEFSDDNGATLLERTIVVPHGRRTAVPPVS